MAGRIIATVLAFALSPACGVREDPARAAFRQRLQQDAALSSEELGRFRADILQAMDGKAFLQHGPVARELDAEQRATVFGMLTEPAGLFDEGIRREQGGTFRVLNAPGRSTSQEIEASRRLWVDVET